MYHHNELVFIVHDSASTSGRCDVFFAIGTAWSTLFFVLCFVPSRIATTPTRDTWKQTSGHKLLPIALKTNLSGFLVLDISRNYNSLRSSV